jgi:hypothetical protein
MSRLMGQHYTGPIIPYRYMASGALEPLNAYMNEYTNRKFQNPSSQVPSRSVLAVGHLSRFAPLS